MSQDRIRSVGFARLAIPSLLAFLGLLLVGCEGTSVSHIGIVRFDDGSPVQSGSIEFRSLADGSRYASRIARDGGFALTDQDGKFGCPLGDYEVVIVQIVLTEDLAAEDHQHGHTVPRRYADYYTTDLRVTNAADRGKSPLEITVEVDEE